MSFTFSLVFAALGFCVIILSILMIDSDATTVEQRTWIGIISGTVIEAVSVLFFTQSNRARELMTNFFDRLRTDRKFDESLSIADKMADSDMKLRLQVLLALSFAEVEAGHETIAELFGVTEPTSPSPPISP